eukprot:c17227_g1_i1 orf=13-240(-)
MALDYFSSQKSSLKNIVGCCIALAPPSCYHQKFSVHFYHFIKAIIHVVPPGIPFHNIRSHQGSSSASYQSLSCDI